MSGDGIDTRFVLALHALGTESFGAGRVAALPRPAVGFPLDALRFFPPRVAEDGEKAHRFAMHVNARIVPPTGTPAAHYLWDEYEEVLDPAMVRLAERLPTPEETARYDAARAFLTPEVMAAYGSATQVLGTAKLRLGTARAGRPPEGSAEEPAWRAEVEAAQEAVRLAEVELAVRGRADEVRAAIATVENWSAAATALSWSEHADDVELAKLGSVDGGEYLLTTFSPSDVVDGRGWARFELLPDRIEGLVAGLGPLAEGGADSGRVRRMTVELTHVMIDRPWYDPGVFRSGAWRFADPGRPPVSDGASGGTFPYLVTGLVLARSLTLELTPAPAGQPPDPAPLQLGYLEGLELVPERLVPVEPIDPFPPDPVVPEHVVDPGLAVSPDRVVDPGRFVDRTRFKVGREVLADRAAVVQPAFERLAVDGLAVDAAALRVSPARDTVDRSVLLDRSAVLGFGGRFADATRADTGEAVVRAVPVRRGTALTRATLSPELLATLVERDFASADPVVGTAPAPATGETRTLVGADEAIVVAYLLEPVGTAPDPDPALHWS